jgi:hypothetical protein
MDLIVVYLLYLSLLPKAINTEATEIADPGAFASAQRRTRPTRKPRVLTIVSSLISRNLINLNARHATSFPQRIGKKFGKVTKAFRTLRSIPNIRVVSVVIGRSSLRGSDQSHISVVTAMLRPRLATLRVIRFRVSARSSWLLIKRRALFRTSGFIFRTTNISM